MNNYCTNCGKKLGKKEVVCESCNTPIIDIPHNYKNNSKKRKNKIIHIIILCLFIIILLCLINKVVKNNKINELQKEYVDPYIQEHYGNIDYTVESTSTGKCIISGDCEYDLSDIGCGDAVSCDEYEYLDKNECKSYYYSIKTDTKDFIITVVKKNNKYYVVEGKNIYEGEQIDKLQKEYVEPYIQEHYGNIDYIVESTSTGKCIISGDCKYDLSGCDGGYCEEYEYLDKNECKSYYYSIKTDTKDFIITVVEKNNEYYALEGKNIYEQTIENEEYYN